MSLGDGVVLFFAVIGVFTTSYLLVRAFEVLKELFEDK